MTDHADHIARLRWWRERVCAADQAAFDAAIVELKRMERLEAELDDANNRLMAMAMMMSDGPSVTTGEPEGGDDDAV